VDESGFMLQPVVRRTWAPRGQTPVLKEWDRHDRLSVVSALTVAPKRRRFGLYWKTQRRNICGQDLVPFLRELLRHLRRGIILIWDRWSVHKSQTVRQYLERHADWIDLEWLPSYAPELNPDEQAWNHAKYGKLANFCPDGLDQLEAAVELAMGNQAREPALLRSFFKLAGLKL
jgi:transposase